jgi:hypothetical protein
VKERKVNKTLSLPLDTVERLERESDETDTPQSEIVDEQLRKRYEMEQ